MSAKLGAHVDFLLLVNHVCIGMNEIFLASFVTIAAFHDGGYIK